jgi:hypothetical protein
MTEERIDLSALDPSQDRERWEAIAKSVASRALAARRRPGTVARQVLAWSRPVLAIAATVALVSWAAAWANRPRTAAVNQPQAEPAFVLARWAMVDERPSADQMLQVLGADHGTE